MVVKQQHLIKRHFHCSAERSYLLIPAWLLQRLLDTRNTGERQGRNTGRVTRSKRRLVISNWREVKGQSRQLMSKHNYSRRPDNFIEVAVFSPFIWKPQGWFSVCLKASSCLTYGIWHHQLSHDARLLSEKLF